MRRCTARCAAGVDRARIVIDPGLGFGKRKEQNAEILAHLGDLAALELPIAIGPSRKSFLAELNSFGRYVARVRNRGGRDRRDSGRSAHRAGARCSRDEAGGRWWRIKSSIPLALRTVVRPTLAHHDPADRRSAGRARLAGASVNLVLLLEAAFLAVGVDVIGNRRAFEPNRGVENVHHGLMQTSGALPCSSWMRWRAGECAPQKRFVGIDVPHAAQKSLIEQQRLDA